jgi:hypothetical protein
MWRCGQFYSIVLYAQFFSTEKPIYNVIIYTPKSSYFYLTILIFGSNVLTLGQDDLRVLRQMVLSGLERLRRWVSYVQSSGDTFISTKYVFPGIFLIQFFESDNKVHEKVTLLFLYKELSVQISSAGMIV